MRRAATLMLIGMAACAGEPVPPPPAAPPPPNPARLTQLVPSLRGRLARAEDLPTPPDPADADYAIQPGDLVQVAPESGPALLRLVVDHSGQTRRAETNEPMNLPMVGMTRAQVRSLFEEQFAALAPHSGVIVHVRPHAACDPHHVVVIRENAGVDRIAWRFGVRLHEALGPDDAHSDRFVWILRPSDGRFILCDFWNYFATADPRHDPALEADDIVFLQSRDDADLFMMLSLMEGTLTPEEFAEALGVTRP